MKNNPSSKLQFKLLRRRYFILLNVGFSLVRLKERTKTTRYGDEYVLYKQILWFPSSVRRFKTILLFYCPVGCHDFNILKIHDPWQWKHNSTFIQGTNGNRSVIVLLFRVVIRFLFFKAVPCAFVWKWAKSGGMILQFFKQKWHFGI